MKRYTLSHHNLPALPLLIVIEKLTTEPILTLRGKREREDVWLYLRSLLEQKPKTRPSSIRPGPVLRSAPRRSAPETAVAVCGLSCVSPRIALIILLSPPIELYQAWCNALLWKALPHPTPTLNSIADHRAWLEIEGGLCCTALISLPNQQSMASAPPLSQPAHEGTDAATTAATAAAAGEEDGYELEEKDWSRFKLARVFKQFVSRGEIL